MGDFGTVKSEAEIRADYEEANYESLAQSAWDRGDYVGYVSNKLQSWGASIESGVRSTVRDFTNAPLDALEKAIKNPLVQTGLVATGLAAAIPAVEVVDAVTDYFQDEATASGALRQVGAAALTATPVGQVLGPFQGVAAEAIADPEKAAETVAGFAGGALGGQIGTRIGAVTRNPYVSMATGIVGSVAGAGWASEQAKAPSTGMSPTRTARATRDTRKDPREAPVSPLVSTGEEAVAASQRLMQPAQATGLVPPMYSHPIARYGTPSAGSFPTFGYA